jgi:1-aminocyclopropane-1-carboxylate deaminase
MELNISGIELQQVHLAEITNAGVELYILRLDQVHPVISGNKLFKLHYFLKEAVESDHRHIVTLGGAYSNHLVASAFAASALGLKTTGIVRGEKPAKLSPTLEQCIAYGMDLHFVSRSDFVDAETIQKIIETKIGKCVFIPEGGYHQKGASGAALIMNLITNDPTHICMPAGTATTLAGIYASKNSSQELVVVPVIKNMADIPERLEFLTGIKPGPDLVVFDQYHFGGYAKRTEDLVSFMNRLYAQTGIPTDFVYTAKMMFGIIDMISRHHFPRGSRILCLHTGGLQGNSSLPEGTLVF